MTASALSEFAASACLMLVNGSRCTELLLGRGEQSHCGPSKLSHIESRRAFHRTCACSNVDVITPAGKMLARQLTVAVQPGHSLLVSGPNGCGKTSIFRWGLRCSHAGWAAQWQPLCCHVGLLFALMQQGRPNQLRGIKYIYIFSFGVMHAAPVSFAAAVALTADDVVPCAGCWRGCGPFPMAPSAAQGPTWLWRGSGQPCTTCRSGRTPPPAACVTRCCTR